MSRIDELIRELCPEGVGNVPLGTFIEEVKARAGLNTALPVYGISNSLGFLPSGEIFNTSRASSDRSGYKVVQPSDVAYNPSRINVGSIAMSRETMPVIVSPMYVVFSIKDGLDPEFLEHFMRSTVFKSQVLANIEVGARFRFTFEAMANVRVPVPPIEVQREIVSILDKFTQLEAELEAELEARRTQYEVTRDRLLDFSGDLSSHPMGDKIRELCPEGVSKHRLGDVLQRRKGINITAGKMKTLSRGNAQVRIFAGGQTMVDVDSSQFPQKQLISEPGIIVKSRGKVEFAYWESMFTHKSEIWSYTQGPDEVDVKYVFYLLKSKAKFFQELARSKSVKMPQLSVGDTDDLIIPVPPLQVQKEIVSILDKLDALVNDITFGLPAEIEARRKQYEYYRNKLLTFKELDAA